MLMKIRIPIQFKTLAIAAAIVGSTCAPALAQYACPAGYTYNAGVCQPNSPGYGNPVSGAASGTAAGAAAGNSAAGPVGAVVGGALGLATGTVAGTAGAVSGTTGAIGNAMTPAAPAPTCAAGYVFRNGYCYPAR
jgi:hypothetical protein